MCCVLRAERSGGEDGGGGDGGGGSKVRRRCRRRCRLERVVGVGCWCRVEVASLSRRVCGEGVCGCCCRCGCG